MVGGFLRQADGVWQKLSSSHGHRHQRLLLFAPPTFRGRRVLQRRPAATRSIRISFSRSPHDFSQRVFYTHPRLVFSSGHRETVLYDALRWLSCFTNSRAWTGSRCPGEIFTRGLATTWLFWWIKAGDVHTPTAANVKEAAC